jgi:hypothetical protein
MLRHAEKYYSDSYTISLPADATIPCHMVALWLGQQQKESVKGLTCPANRENRTRTIQGLPNRDNPTPGGANTTQTLVNGCPTLAIIYTYSRQFA